MSDLWLARLVIDPRQRDAHRDLRSVTALHRRVMSLFPDTDQPSPRAHFGVLYRLDNTRTGPVLLLQANTRPDPEHLPVGYGDLEVIDAKPFLSALHEGASVRYRIVLNATKRVAAGNRAGRRIALGAGPTRTWWAERADQHGLALIADPTLVAQQLRGNDRRDGTITIRPWRLDGAATVTDPGALRRSIREGIGKGRAYGCGLLSVALV